MVDISQMLIQIMYEYNCSATVALLILEGGQDGISKHDDKPQPYDRVRSAV